jgi:23S rRNA (uracil1939-C5)-methyltransferase
MLQNSEPLLLHIDKLVQGGLGLAHHGSHAVFVPGVLPGESVRIAIERARKGYAEARLLEVATPSAERISPPCPIYGRCGGCQLQHASYSAQLQLKRDVLIETLGRVGGIHDVEVPPVIPSPQPFGYRNRARFSVAQQGGPSTAVLAFHEERSHRLVPVDECLLLAPLLNEALAQLNKLLPSARDMMLQEISLATSFTTGEVVIQYTADHVSRRRVEDWFARVRESHPVKGQALCSGRGREARRWVDGEMTLTERIGDCVFRMSDRSFAQANWKLNELLIGDVKQWVLETTGSTLRVLELYAGIGNLGLPIARGGALMTFVEGNRAALADARENARINHIGRCRFRAASAEAFLQAAVPGEYDVVLLDPPRTGLSAEALAGLLRLQSKRILYVSCDPPTLARDLRAFRDAGYRLGRLQSYDMFPQTMHLETVVELIGPAGLFH